MSKKQNKKFTKDNESIIEIEDSFETSNEMGKQQPQSSVIVINDTLDISSELPKVMINTPSKSGNVSFDQSKDSTPRNQSSPKPSLGGFTPSKYLITTPGRTPTPCTPKNILDESFDKCNMKKIVDTQKKLLDELYGNIWRSIPKLIKNDCQAREKFGGISKQLNFNENDKNDYNNLNHFDNFIEDDTLNNKVKVKGANTETKSKRKLYTHDSLDSMDLEPNIIRKINSTTKKLKHVFNDRDFRDNVRIDPIFDGFNNKFKTGKSKKKLFQDKENTPPCDSKNTKKKTVTEIVDLLNKDVEKLTDGVKGVHITSNKKLSKLSFIASLADDVQPWQCDLEALQYREKYKLLKAQLTRRLFVEFNRVVFDNVLDDDMTIEWDTKLRTTAGTTTHRSVKTPVGDRIRTSSIKLSTKVLDSPQRLRDTLIHELCHAATWLIDGEMRAGHGPTWKKWVTKALKRIPELEEISRCHDLLIHHKYTYRCTKCGYSVQRHSKSIDVTKKCCGYCRGKFEILANKKNKDGVVVSTPARKGEMKGFALFVKENYSSVKKMHSNHAETMQILGEQYAKLKKNIQDR